MKLFEGIILSRSSELWMRWDQKSSKNMMLILDGATFLSEIKGAFMMNHGSLYSHKNCQGLRKL